MKQAPLYVLTLGSPFKKVALFFHVAWRFRPVFQPTFLLQLNVNQMDYGQLLNYAKTVIRDPAVCMKASFILLLVQ